MKNIEQILIDLENHNMFVVVDKKYVQNFLINNHITGYRNDGLGSRLLTYVNIARLSKKLGCDFNFYWDIRSDKNSPSYPQNVSTDINSYLPNLKNIKFFNSKYTKICQPSITEWKIIVLKNEKKSLVLKECSKIMREIFANALVKPKKNLKFKYGLHLRLGDIDAYTNRNYNNNNLIAKRENFNLGKWYPPIFWLEIYTKIKSKVLIAGSDYKTIKKIFKSSTNITFSDRLVSSNKDETFKFIFDLILVSKAKNIICSFASGSGLVICLLSKNRIFTPESFLKLEKVYFEFYNIILSNFLKHNTFKSLIRHNLRYIFSKIVDFKLNFVDNWFKKKIK